MGILTKNETAVFPLNHIQISAHARASGAQNGYVQIKLRFYSGKHIFECARIVPADQTVRLKTSLAKWKYRSKVTKIQVMAAPVNGSQWNANAQLVMNAPVRSR